ncbi:MAG: PEP-CTERM sorting domain-containing protein [bacterium]|nr:PEP-CTERM sorting domain-containing protein [bacterium]
MLSHVKRLAGMLLVTAVLATAVSAQTIVYSNNPAPGDLFVNAGPANQGQAVGTSGWYYNNVRNNGVVGINTTYPWNGNGSVYFNTPSGAAKADIEYLVNAVSVSGNFFSAGVIAPFSQLQSLSYRWYRDSSSTVAAHFHPVVRVLLDADGNLLTTSDRGGLVWEGVYQTVSSPWTPASAPTNSWQSYTVTDSSYMWNFGLGIGFAANINSTPYAYDATLAEWKNYFPNAVIIGFSMGVGSGWNGVFTGAVDGISWTINGQTTSFNFEVVPEPATMALFGLGLAVVGGLLYRRVA